MKKQHQEGCQGSGESGNGLKVWGFAVGQTAAVALPVGDTSLNMRCRSKKKTFHAPQGSLIHSFMPFPMEMQVKYVANPTCRCLKAGALKSSQGQVTSVQSFADPDFAFPYAPEIPEQSHWQLLDTWDFCSYAAFGNVVHCGGSCHVLLFICFYSHLLLAALCSQAWQIFRSWAALT